MSQAGVDDIERVRQFLALFPDGVASSQVAEALGLDIGRVLLARVALAKSAANSGAAG